jgi:hypothetical protein
MAGDQRVKACPDCGKEVSRRASACIHCGAPLAAEGAVSTVQQTGKKWKAMQLAGAALMIFGVVSCSAQGDAQTSALALMIGFVVFVGARIGAWWNHG